jgi:predicted transcriptional regulator
MKNRGTAQILSSMLKHAEGAGVRQTTIMYKSYLSLPQLRQYLELLQDNGMLEYASETRLYRTTEKGIAFRKSYDEVAQALAPKA